MRTPLIVLSILVASLIGAPATAVAGAADGGRPLSATLTGAAEVPGPGDPDASGTASFELNQGQGMVCFAVSWQNIDGTVVAAHIHVAPAGTAGPVVVPLFAGAFSGTDTVSRCVANVSEDLIKSIRHDPSAFYVNVHSTVFPDGAARGQLSSSAAQAR